MRIQIDQLRLPDLIQYPIWEYALDEEGAYGQDEHTVRPVIGFESIDPSQKNYIARATFRAHDGTQFVGSIKPQSTKPDALVTRVLPYDFWPMIYLDEATKICFGFGTIEPTSAQLTQAYQALGKKPFNLFPLTFSSDVTIANGLGIGRIDGFMYFVSSNKLAHTWTEVDLRIIL